MSRDLEEQLGELGPECRAVVARLRAGREVEPCKPGAGSSADSRSSRFYRQAYLVAASLLVAVVLGVLFPQSNNRTIEQSEQSNNRTIEQSEQSNNPPSAPREYVMTVPEMLATQNPDGSWKNDFLTRRNAEALRLCTGSDARIAYKKAMRNLRARGLL